MKKFEFDYFRANESEQYLFLQLPIMLIKDEKFKGLSASAKILYSLFLNRTALSAKNEWLDENGRVYIIYTVDEIMKDLNCWEQKVTKDMKDLREIGLIQTVRRGLNKPNLIYVMNFATEYKYSKNDKKEPENPDNIRKCENHKSGDVKITSQKVRKSQSINININENNFNKNEVSIVSENPEILKNDSIPNTDNDSIDNEKIYSHEEVANKISLEELKNKYSADRHEEIEMMYHIICEVLTGNDHLTPILRISKQNILFKDVKQTFSKLTMAHIEYVLDSLEKNDNKYKIKGRIDNYLRTALFHAPRTIQYFKHTFQKAEQPKDRFSELIEQKIKRDAEKRKMELEKDPPEYDFDDDIFGASSNF